MNLPFQKDCNRKYGSLKSTKCIKCGNGTYEKDSICVLCRKYIPRMYEELIDLLTEDNKRNLKKIKIRLSRKDNKIASTSRKSRLKSKV